MRKYRSSEKDFSRERTLTFPVVVKSILHLFKESVEYNMQKVLPLLGESPVTGSAFSQARYKVRYEFFCDLCSLVRDFYEDMPKKRWKGIYRLIAGDGSTLSLPNTEEVEDYFGVHATTDMGVNRCLSNIFFFYDVLNNFVVESSISETKNGEKTLMQGCIDDNCLRENDIIILDRGFGSINIIKEFEKQGLFYCIRLSSSVSNFAKKVMALEADDMIVDWSLSSKERSTCRDKGLNCDAEKVRIIKIKLKSGETELLVTNLFDQDFFSEEDMNDLYHYRWAVEEGFKNLKPKMKIEQFGARKQEGIYQEFYAHIFNLNMIGIAGMISNIRIEKKTNHRERQYKYNWQNAYRFYRDKIILLLKGANLKKHITDLIDEISSSIIPIRPGRSFNRDMKSCNKRTKTTQCYK